MKIRSHYFFEETWKCGLWLVWPVQNEELDKFIHRNFGIKDKTKDGSFAGRFVEIYRDENMKEQWAGLIALQHWRGSPLDYSTLAHECLHAVRWFLKYRGVELSGKTEETYCYFLDSLVRRCAEQLNKRRRQ